MGNVCSEKAAAQHAFSFAFWGSVAPTPGVQRNRRGQPPSFFGNFPGGASLVRGWTSLQDESRDQPLTYTPNVLEDCSRRSAGKKVTLELVAYRAALCLTVPSSQNLSLAPDAARFGETAEDAVVIPAVLYTGAGV